MKEIYCKLKDVCEIKGGYAFKSNYFIANGIPIIRIGDISSNKVNISQNNVCIDVSLLYKYEKYIIRKGDILVALSGATTGKFGIYDNDRIALLNQRVGKIVPTKRLNNRYMYHYMNKLQGIILINAMGAAQPNISPSGIENLSIYVPDLKKQLIISNILDKAQELIDKRKIQIEALDELIKSVFYDMFGDPSCNPMGWDNGKIEDIIIKTQYGTSSKADLNNGEFEMLRMNNITYNGDWNFNSIKYVDLDKKDQEKYLVYKGEVLFNRTNSKELVGKTAVYKKDKPMAFAGYLIKMIPNNRANGTFIATYMNTKYTKSTLLNMAKCIVGMANINAEELKSINIYIPPIELQNKFENLVDSIEKQKELLQQSLIQLENNFNSVMQKAFNGEIFN